MVPLRLGLLRVGDVPGRVRVSVQRDGLTFYDDEVERFSRRMPPARATCSSSRCTTARACSERDDRAGQGPPDALHRLDPRDDHLAKFVEAVRLHAGDDVEGACHDVGYGDPAHSLMA